MEYEKTLMTVDEFCNYVGIGKTKARELISLSFRSFIHSHLFCNISL